MSTDLDMENEIETLPAKDTDGVPYCRKHHCRMKQTSGGKRNNPKSYYGCPVPGCEEKARTIKTANERVVPSQPQKCERCSSRTNQPVYCERDEASSSAAKVVVKCPRCGWKSSAMVTPQLAAMHLESRKRTTEGGVGDR